MGDQEPVVFVYGKKGDKAFFFFLSFLLCCVFFGLVVFTPATLLEFPLFLRRALDTNLFKLEDGMNRSFLSFWYIVYIN